MIIIRDTREKAGYWDFTPFPECTGQIVQGLKTADYTIQGYETKVVIERKKTVSEIALNLGSKFATFKKEFIRMKEFEKAYVLCEFSFDDVLIFPAMSRLPKRLKAKIKMTGKFILNQINQLEEEFNIPFIFCNNKSQAEQMAMDIFKEVVNVQG